MLLPLTPSLPSIPGSPFVPFVPSTPSVPSIPLEPLRPLGKSISKELQPVEEQYWNSFSSSTNIRKPKLLFSQSGIAEPEMTYIIAFTALSSSSEPLSSTSESLLVHPANIEDSIRVKIINAICFFAIN